MGVRGGVSRPGAWWSWVVVLAFWLSCVVEVVMLLGLERVTWAWAVVKVVQGALLVGLAWLDARAGAGRTAVVVTRQVAEGGACGGQQ